MDSLGRRRGQGTELRRHSLTGANDTRRCGVSGHGELGCRSLLFGKTWKLLPKQKATPPLQAILGTRSGSPKTSALSQSGDEEAKG